jgi:hypothetical protein
MAAKQCPQCGTQFEGRANKLYCSTKCKMAAFYSPHAENRSTDNGFNYSLENEPLTDNQFPQNQSEKPSTVKPMKEEKSMAVIPVSFTTAEKELLERQASECETVLPKLIRIRCLMDETDIQEMQQLIDSQKQQIEELRVKLSFYQEHEGSKEPVKRITDKPLNGLLIEMSEKQLVFLREKYLESFDFKNTDGCRERLSDGSFATSERESLEFYERQKPGHIHWSIGNMMIYTLLRQIEGNLVENCGYDEEEFIDNPLIDEFDDLKQSVKR